MGYSNYSLILFFFKVNFIKIHYFLINVEKFRYSEKYISVVYFLVTWPTRFVYFLHCIGYINIKHRRKLRFVVNYFLEFVLIILLVVDCCFFDFVLKTTIFAIPYYGILKYLYNINYYLSYNMEYLYDIVVTELVYSNQSLILDQEFDLIINDYIYNKLLK